MDQDIKKAEERLEYLSSDPKTIAVYKAREKSLHERANMINGAREEGIEKGIEKTALNLLSMNMDIEIVMKATGLGKEKIEQIRRSLN